MRRDFLHPSASDPEKEEFPVKKFNYRLIMEGDIVAATEEEGQKLLVQAVKQLIQQAHPNHVEALVVDGILPAVVEGGPAEANGMVEAIDRLGERIEKGIAGYTEMGRQAMTRFLDKIENTAKEAAMAGKPATARPRPAADDGEPGEPVGPEEVMGE
jgi:hypothetical protein